jgi:hypothetical protein
LLLLLSVHARTADGHATTSASACEEKETHKKGKRAKTRTKSDGHAPLLEEEGMMNWPAFLVDNLQTGQEKAKALGDRRRRVNRLSFLLLVMRDRGLRSG